MLQIQIIKLGNDHAPKLFKISHNHLASNYLSTQSLKILNACDQKVSIDSSYNLFPHALFYFFT